MSEKKKSLNEIIEAMTPTQRQDYLNKLSIQSELIKTEMWQWAIYFDGKRHPEEYIK